MYPYIGQMTLFPSNRIPFGWMLCDGRLLPIFSAPTLFSVIGNYYGGDGMTNFALPDLRGRVAVSGPNVAAAGGVPQVALADANLPDHNHDLHALTATGSKTAAPGNALAVGLTGNKQNGYVARIYSANAPTTTLLPASIGPAGNQTPAPHNNMQPYLALAYCIAVDGQFPNR